MAHLPDHSQSLKALSMYINELVYVLNKSSKVFIGFNTNFTEIMHNFEFSEVLNTAVALTCG